MTICGGSPEPSNTSNHTVLTCFRFKLLIKWINQSQTAENYPPLKSETVLLHQGGPNAVLNRAFCGPRILLAECLLLRQRRVSTLSGSHTTTLISINTDGDLIPTLRQRVTRGLCLCWHHHRITAGCTRARRQQHGSCLQRKGLLICRSLLNEQTVQCLIHPCETGWMPANKQERHKKIITVLWGSA